MVDCDGQSCLHHAALAGHAEVCRALLEHCPVALADCQQRTTLHLAARHGHAPVARALLVELKSSEVWAKDCDRLSALHCAAFRGHKDFCEELLRHESFREATGEDLELLRHARDDPRTDIRKPFSPIENRLNGCLGPGIRPRNGRQEVRPLLSEALSPLGMVFEAQEEQETADIATSVPTWSPKSSQKAPHRVVTAKEIFSDPLVAIHQQLLAAERSCAEYFQQLDQDNDGQLTVEELQSCLQSLG